VPVVRLLVVKLAVAVPPEPDRVRVLRMFAEVALPLLGAS
jgi:hypothetical protein